MGVVNELQNQLTTFPSAFQLFETIAKQMIDTFDVSKLISIITAQRGSAKLVKYNQSQNEQPTDSERLMKLRAIDPDHLASFVNGLLVAKASDVLMMELAFKIALKASLIDEQELSTLWLPFIRQLMRIETDVPTFTTRLRFIAQAIMETFCEKKALVTSQPGNGDQLPKGGSAIATTVAPSKSSYQQSNW